MGALNIIWGMIMMLSWSLDAWENTPAVTALAQSEVLCPLDAGADTSVCGFDHILMGNRNECV